MSYKAASFFSGIGGIDLAFSWSGFDIVFQCEIDEYCQQVLRKHAPEYWPHAKLRGDIKHVTKADVGHIDVLFGGFPCQDISIAGKQAGLTAGTRSGLWFELLRLIGEIRPRVVLLENVSNITVVGGSTVTATLAEVGYDALWLPLRASDIGAPHQRERWFCLAYDCGERFSKQKRAPRPAYHRKRHNQTKQRLQISGQIKPNGQALSKLAYSAGQQRKWRKPSRNRKRQSQRALRNRSRYTGIMGNSKCQRLERAQQLRGSKVTSEGCRRLRRKQSNGLKSRLGRVAHGFSARLDRHNGYWPARPNERQYDYEPPRLTGRKENRVNRIRALGNAVVPQQVLPVVRAIKMFLDAA